MPFEIQYTVKIFQSVWRPADRRVVFVIDGGQLVATRKSIDMA